MYVYSKGKDQPGKVANSARGQLNREKIIPPCPRSRLRIWSRETGSAVPSRVSLLISILIWWLLTGFLPISAAASIYLCKTAIRHRVYREFVGSRNCVPMVFTAESPSAQGQASKPQGSFERVLPWQVTMDQIICASLSHTHYWYEVGMLKVTANNGGLLPDILYC